MYQTAKGARQWKSGIILSRGDDIEARTPKSNVYNTYYSTHYLIWDIECEYVTSRDRDQIMSKYSSINKKGSKSGTNGIIWKLEEAKANGTLKRYFSKEDSIEAPQPNKRRTEEDFSQILNNIKNESVQEDETIEIVDEEPVIEEILTQQPEDIIQPVMEQIPGAQEIQEPQQIQPQNLDRNEGTGRTGLRPRAAIRKPDILQVKRAKITENEVTNEEFFLQMIVQINHAELDFFHKEALEKELFEQISDSDNEWTTVENQRKKKSIKGRDNKGSDLRSQDVRYQREHNGIKDAARPRGDQLTPRSRGAQTYR